MHVLCLSAGILALLICMSTLQTEKSTSFIFGKKCYLPTSLFIFQFLFYIFLQVAFVNGIFFSFFKTVFMCTGKLLIFISL